MSGPAPIIVTALLGAPYQNRFDRERQLYYPPSRNVLPAHLTLFHHLPPSLADEVKQRLAEAVRNGRPSARVAGLMSLGRGVAYRIESPMLEELREGLRRCFEHVLTPQDAAPWRPHITIQNKVAPAQARDLLDDLRRNFKPDLIEITGLASWWYRGGPWEKLSRHMFA